MEENIDDQVYTEQQYYEPLDTSGHEEYHEQKSPLREQDRFLPIANVAKIMKKAVPANGKIAKESKECVQECVSEFISFITSEAAERCHNEKRKTVNGEDLLYAINSLGFDNYLEPLKKYLQKFRESSKLDTSILDDSNLVSLTQNPNGQMTTVILNLQGTPLTLQTTTNSAGQTIITSQQADSDQNAPAQTLVVNSTGEDGSMPQQIFLTTSNGQTRLASAESIQQLTANNQIIITSNGNNNNSLNGNKNSSNQISETAKIDEDVKLPSNAIFLPVTLVNGSTGNIVVSQASESS